MGGCSDFASFKSVAVVRCGERHGHLGETVREFELENAGNPRVSNPLNRTTRRIGGIGAAIAVTKRRIGSTEFPDGAGSAAPPKVEQVSGRAALRWAAGNE